MTEPQRPYDRPETGDEQYRHPAEYERGFPPWFTITDVFGEEYREGLGTYFDRHDVRRPEQTTWDDRPIDQTEYSTYRFEAYDRRAFDQLSDGDATALVGKWRISCDTDRVNMVWNQLLDHARQAVMGAKVSPAGHVYTQGCEQHVIIAYTPNYFDVSNVMEVRTVLRERVGVEETIIYKPDLFSELGINDDNYDEQTNLPFPGRFRA